MNSLNLCNHMCMLISVNFSLMKAAIGFQSIWITVWVFWLVRQVHRYIISCHSLVILMLVHSYVNGLASVHFCMYLTQNTQNVPFFSYLLPSIYWNLLSLWNSVGRWNTDLNQPRFTGWHGWWAPLSCGITIQCFWQWRHFNWIIQTKRWKWHCTWFTHDLSTWD